MKKNMTLEEGLREALDAQVPQPDELTRAALKAARYRALDELPEQGHSWWQPALAAAAAVLLAVIMVWQMPAGQEPQEIQLASHQVEDAAVIADLDLVLWLEEGGV